MKFNQTYIDKNPIFILDYNQIANSCVLVLKFMWFVVLFTISRFFIFKLATDLISIENSQSAEIGQVTDFRGLKSDQWPISVMEIGSLNQPLSVNKNGT